MNGKITMAEFQRASAIRRMLTQATEATTAPAAAAASVAPTAPATAATGPLSFVGTRPPAAPAAPRPSWLIRVTEAPGDWSAPVDCRLRKLLKRMLRAYGLKCKACWREPEGPP